MTLMIFSTHLCLRQTLHSYCFCSVLPPMTLIFSTHLYLIQTLHSYCFCSVLPPSPWHWWYFPLTSVWDRLYIRTASVRCCTRSSSYRCNVYSACTPTSGWRWRKNERNIACSSSHWTSSVSSRSLSLYLHLWSLLQFYCKTETNEISF